MVPLSEVPLIVLRMVWVAGESANLEGRGHPQGQAAAHSEAILVNLPSSEGIVPKLAGTANLRRSSARPANESGDGAVWREPRSVAAGLGWASGWRASHHLVSPESCPNSDGMLEVSLLL